MNPKKETFTNASMSCTQHSQYISAVTDRPHNTILWSTHK